MCFKLIFLRKLLIAKTRNIDITFQTKRKRVNHSWVLSPFRFPTLMYRTKLLQFALLSSIYFLFLFLLMIRLRAHSRTIRKIYFRSSLDRHSKWRKREEDHQENLFRTTTRNTDDGETAKRNNESQLIVEEKFRV